MGQVNLEAHEKFAKNMLGEIEKFADNITKDVVAQVFQIIDNHSENLSDEVVEQINKIKPQLN